jgi:transposase
MARLVGSGLATATEVAQVFGVHRNTVGRIAGQVEAEGATAVLPRKPGPRGRHKVTPRVLRVLREAVFSGVSSYEAAREVRRRTGVQLSHGHVYGLMQQLKAERPETLPMDLGESDLPPVQEAEAADTGDIVPVLDTAVEEHVGEGAARMDTPLLPAAGEALHSRYLGLTLFYAALEVTGLLPLAEEVYQLTGPVRFGVRQVFWQLFCLALLQEPTIERVKHLLRTDLGAVIGCGRAACVKTLRRKLAVLSGQRQAVTLGLRLARHWLEVGLLNASYLYVDGHMKVYSGKRLVQEVWNSQRRMPLPGIEQYFVNDLRGRPVLVVSQDVSGNLAKSLPVVIAAIREVLGEQQRFTVIFDRGGYDGKLFAWLGEQQIDFITYQRGEVDLPAEAFHRREVRWEGKRVRYWLAEDTVAVGDSGPWRRIVLRTTDGHQTPILTSLDQEAVAAARVASLMLARWRQENFFKYARAHLGLDVLASYQVDPVADRQVPNPEVKAAKREVQQLRTTAQKVRAALGQTVAQAALKADASPDDAPPPAAAEKRVNRRTATTREALLARLQAIDAEIARVQARLKGLPPQVALRSLGKPHETPQLEPKLIADTVKLAAYNAQSWLADRLVHHYPHPGDLHDLLRAFAQLSGTMTRQPDGVLHVCLDPPDLPLYRRALEGLCQDLNRLHPHFPGTDIPVTYAVATHYSSRVA